MERGNIVLLGIMAFWSILLTLLLCKSCHKDLEKIIVTVPAVSGTFESVKPIHTVITKTKTVTTKDTSLISKLQSENDKLKCDFEKANDSLKLVIFNQAIQLKEFSHTFNDSNITATASGIVRGEVQSLKLNYTIKEKTVIVPKPKETVFRLLGGLEIGNNKTLDNFTAKANLMFQNRKGNIISGSIDMNQNVFLGYNAQIFQVKR